MAQIFLKTTALVLNLPGVRETALVKQAGAYVPGMKMAAGAMARAGVQVIRSP